MLQNLELATDLRLLAESDEYELIKLFFSEWKDEEEMIDKVLLWGNYFMPEYLRDESPEFHRELIRDFFSNKNEYDAAPRGFSKTTIIQVCMCFSIANNLDRFIVVVEKTWSEASEVISIIPDVFKTRDIQKVYGFMVKKDENNREDEDAKEARGDLLVNGVRIRGKGFNTSIRGLKSKAYRPTRILLDDIEEDEHIANEEQRRKYLRNYIKGIIPALDLGAHVKMFGTILHQDSLLANMIRTHKGKIYEAWDRSSGKPPQQCLLWPQRWTYERLMEKKAEMTALNQPSSAFWQEYFNDPISEEDRMFQWAWLQKSYKEEDIKFKVLATYVAIDAADAASDGSDWTGVLIVSIDLEGNWYIRRATREKVDVKGMVDLLFNVWESERPVRIGVEKKSFEDQFESTLKEKRDELRIYPVIRELQHHGTSKENRIAGALQGRFEAGHIFFLEDARDNQNDLRLELFDFPRARWDDLADALAYIDQIAEKPVDRPESRKKKFSGRVPY